MIDAEKLYNDQLNAWPEFRQRVEQLDTVQMKRFDMGGYTIYAQFNPARAVSTNAKLDPKSIAQRKCFLCKENRPEVQAAISLNERFSLLVNPFPILKEHFTLTYNEHHEQAIQFVMDDFLSFCKELPNHTLLYNGPESGASAPDHLHFQAVKKGQLPFEKEVATAEKRVLSEWNGDILEEFTNYGRKCLHIQSKKADKAKSFFDQIYKQYQMLEGHDKEPRMNLFGYFEEDCYHLFLFPRKKHRPDQFFAEGEAFRMISPGAIDIAGVLVLPREKDFEEITPELIKDVFRQVAY